MKRKTSVTLSKQAIAAIDKLARGGRSRSAVIEWAVLELVERETRRLEDEREIALINQHADRLNREALASLADQIDLYGERA